MITRPDTHHIFTGSAGDHDAGLEHGHDWAHERSDARSHQPLVADAAASRTPSSVLHDDAIYVAG